MEIGIDIILVAGLLVVSEVLAFIPSIKENGIFQVIWRALKVLAKDK